LNCLLRATHLVLNAHVQLPRVLLSLAHVYVALERLPWQHAHGLVHVKHCLLPMRVLLVGRSRKHDLFHSMAEVTIKPAYKSMNNAVQLDVKGEATVKV
jgi:hypothetical protein